MPPRKNPYRGQPQRKNGDRAYVFRSVRTHPDLFATLEALAVEEHISVNALCNAIFAIAAELAQTPEGRARIHQACTDWRSRWEHAQPEGRVRRLEEE